MPDLWQAYKQCRALVVPSSLMYAYLGRVFVERRDLSSDMIKENQYRVAVADHRVMVLMASVLLACLDHWR